MTREAEEPEEIDERAADRAVDKARPLTEAERDWLLRKPRPKPKRAP